MHRNYSSLQENLWLLIFIPAIIIIGYSSVEVNDDPSVESVVTTIVLFLIINTDLYREVKYYFNEADPLNAMVRLVSVASHSLANISVFAGVYYIYGVTVAGEHVRGSMHDSLYLSVAAWTSLGYGEVQPYREVQLVVAVEALVGYVYMGLLIGLFIHSFNKASESERLG